MGTIEVLVGMIASGKTTYARKRAKEGALIVSHDELTEMLHGEYRYEERLRDCYRRMEEDIARRAIEWSRDVIVDRTHLTRESRKRWITFGGWPSFADLAKPQVIAVLFPRLTPEEHALIRFQSDPRGRSHQTWIDVARHHAYQADAEPLSLQEGFARILTVAPH